MQVVGEDSALATGNGKLGDAKDKANEAKKGRTRTNRPFPGGTFQDSLEFAGEIHRIGSGGRVRRLTAFNELGKSPSSGPSKDLVTNANKYGLITGNYSAEFLEPTEAAKVICGEAVGVRAKAEDVPPLQGSIFEGIWYQGSAALHPSLRYLAPLGLGRGWRTWASLAAVVN